MNPKSLPCKICQSDAVQIGSKLGKRSQRIFFLYRCAKCGFAFVGNPWTDYAAIYSNEYYEGHGADPLVDYVFELDHPELTIRQYEWRGILKLARALIKIDRSTRWLDFGCGNGGLVRYCRGNGVPEAVGFEEGAIRASAARLGIPMLTASELAERGGSFDVITAIEVLEHIEDPVAVLKQLRSLLRPEGLLFCTTGNAAPHRDKLIPWPYFIPEIHISLFEPQSLSCALEKAGFRAESRGYLPGATDIIRFKILKNLKVHRRSAWEQAVPWPLVSKLADERYRITAHPIGWAA